MMGRALAASLVAAATVGGAAAAEPSGPLLAAACSSCHGMNGESDTGIPPLAGIGGAEIAAALTAFRSGERTGTIMNRIAKGYSDEEIAALAAHFSGDRP